MVCGGKCICLKEVVIESGRKSQYRKGSLQLENLLGSTIHDISRRS